MKVLSISTDRKIFEQGSAVRSRLLGYGGLVEELHTIVFAQKGLGLQDETIHPNIFLYPTKSWSKLCYLWDAYCIAHTIKKSGTHIDLVTAQDPFEVGFLSFFVARLLGARLHIQIHTDPFSSYFKSESLINRIRVVVAKKIIPRADSLHVVSRRIARSIDSYVSRGAPITVLPLFVPRKNVDPKAETLKSLYPQFKKHILVASRLAPEKNIGLAIKAMATIRAKLPDAGLVIVGSGPEEQRLKKLVEDGVLSDRVVFHGWTNDLTSYYASADVFLLTSYYEGFAMTVIEALHEKCPVIMTDVGCAGDELVNGKNGIVIPVDDQDALERAIVRVLTGGTPFDLPGIPFQTKEEYLARYKESWESGLKSGKL